MAAYDQGFPATALNGSVVQVGARLYTWTTAANRWRPSGPAQVPEDLLALYLAATLLFSQQAAIVTSNGFN